MSDFLTIERRNQLKWGLVIFSTLFWCFFISGIILKYSSTSDFNYTKGKLLDVQLIKEYSKDRLGNKVGTYYTLYFFLANSETTYYIDNNFEDRHIDIMLALEDADVVEVWSDGDLFEGKRQRVYKLRTDGKEIIQLESTKNIYVEKSHFALYIALFLTCVTLLLFRPKWLQKLFPKDKTREVSLVNFYFEKFQKRDINELENIVNNPSEFHPDAVKAARKIIKITLKENRNAKN